MYRRVILQKYLWYNILYFIILFVCYILASPCQVCIFCACRFLIIIVRYLQSVHKQSGLLWGWELPAVLSDMHVDRRVHWWTLLKASQMYFPCMQKLHFCLWEDVKRPEWETITDMPTHHITEFVSVLSSHFSSSFLASLCFSEEKKSNSCMTSGLEVITTKQHFDI